MESKGDVIASSVGNINTRQLQLIEYSMNPKANPCENFYEYACGNWANNVDGVSKFLASNALILEYQYAREWNILMYKLQKETGNRLENLVQNYYQSCMNNADLYTPWEYLLWLEKTENITLTSFLKDPAVTGKENATDILRVFMKYGFVGEALTNVMGKLSEFEFKKLLHLLDVEMDHFDYEKLWMQIKEIDDKITSTLGDRPDENKLLEYVQNEISHNGTDKDQSQTFDHHIFGKYLIIRFVKYLYTMRPKTFVAEGCILATRDVLASVMEWIYLQYHPDIFDGVYELFNTMKEEVNRTFLRNPYGFKESSLNYIINKLDKMQLKIGTYPAENAENILNNLYKNIEIKASDFYGNHLKLLALKRETNLANPPCSIIVGEHVIHFNHECNRVYFPFYTIRQPIYHKDLHDFFKYTSLGFILAHEIMHAFTFDRLQFDAEGKPNEEMYQTFLDNPFYGNATEEVQNRYGETAREKLSDITGLAYINEIVKNRDISIPAELSHSEFTKDQLFFLNSALVFCVEQSFDVFRDQHGKNRDRVNDIVENFPKFDQAFNCHAKKSID
ncbi:neprilysin-2-like [Haematobia irritans]|uniref:neprilysin-2-like n=1 Tax=Haematobia irritans TaxID=7368 RepID=UPI003F4FEC2C